MVVLGLILILLGLVIGGYTVMAGLPTQAGADVSLSFLGLNVETSAVVVFALGALTLLLIELGVLAMRSGARKSAKRRAELQRLRRVEAEVQSRQSAEVQRNATAPMPPATSPAPFARRDSSGDTGSTETVRTDRPDTSGEGHRAVASGDSYPESRRDLADVRPPETSTRQPAPGSSDDDDFSGGATRVDRP